MPLLYCEINSYTFAFIAFCRYAFNIAMRITDNPRPAFASPIAAPRSYAFAFIAYLTVLFYAAAMSHLTLPLLCRDALRDALPLQNGTTPLYAFALMTMPSLSFACPSSDLPYYAIPLR